MLLRSAHIAFAQAGVRQTLNADFSSTALHHGFELLLSMTPSRSCQLRMSFRQPLHRSNRAPYLPLCHRLLAQDYAVAVKSKAERSLQVVLSAA